MTGTALDADVRLALLVADAVDVPATAVDHDRLLTARAAAAGAALDAVAAGRDARWQAAWLRVRLADLPAWGAP